MSWDEYINNGITAVQRCDHAAADQALKQALKFAKQNFERTDDRLALTLSLLGHMYFHNVDFRQAEMLLEQSLRLHSESHTLNEPCVLMDVFSLGEIKLALGKRIDACHLYEKTIARLKAAAESDESGVLLPAATRFQQLLDRQMALLTYTERLELVQPELIQSILAASAGVGTDTGAHAHAHARDKECNEQEICDRAAAQHEHSGTAFDGAAAIEHGRTAGDGMGAAEREGTAGDGTVPPPAGTERLSEEALSATGTHSISEVWRLQLSNGLAALGKDDDENESWVAAYLNLESALRLARHMFPPGDPRLTETIKALADASFKLRMFEQAELLYRDAIASAKQGADGQPLSVEVLRLSLALFYADFDRFAQAKKIFDATKLPENFKQSPLGETLIPRIEKACEQIAIYYASQNLLRQAQTAEEAAQLEKAARLSNTALSTLRQGFAPSHPEHARLLRYRSNILRLLGQLQQSDELAQRAERIERTNDTASSNWAKITHELPKPDIQQVPV